MSARLLLLAVSASAQAGAALAQTPAIQSIAPSMDLGPVVSAPGGPTVFRADAATGAVARVSGAGYRVTGGTARTLVTVSCGSDPLCDTGPVLVTVHSIGAGAGRMGALDNFTAAPNSATFLVPPVGTDPLMLTLGPIGQNATASFYVGADIPVLGNDSGQPSGSASSAFVVDVEIAGGGMDGDTGQAAAQVFRPLSLDAVSNLVFGAIVLPASGEGTVTVDAATGQRILTGAGVQGIGAPARAVFAVSGEGGQSFSVSVLGSFEMTGPGEPIEVALSDDVDGAQLLNGAAGETVDATFYVGGAFAVSSATVPGAYSGTFEVTVQYE